MLGLLAATAGHALDLGTTSGSTYSGEIAWTAGETVFLVNPENRLVLLKKAALDGSAADSVSAWEAANEDLTELPTKFDQAPRLVKKRVPQRSDLAGVDSGVVMFALVVDENGTVEQVVVKDASDARLVEPTTEAVRHWKFSPLRADANKTRGVVFMPVQF